MRNSRHAHTTAEIHHWGAVALEAQDGTYIIRRLNGQSGHSNTIPVLRKRQFTVEAQQSYARYFVLNSCNDEFLARPASGKQVEVVSARGHRTVTAPVATVIAAVLQVVREHVGVIDCLAEAA